MRKALYRAEVTLAIRLGALCDYWAKCALNRLGKISADFPA
jgi:hypothetical protein